jgi:hypothetical protein
MAYHCAVAEPFPSPAQPASLSVGNTGSWEALVIRERFSFNQVAQVLGGLLDQDRHAKRVDALRNATVGLLH